MSLNRALLDPNRKDPVPGEQMTAARHGSDLQDLLTDVTLTT